MILRRVINYMTMYSINVRENRRGDQNGQSRETGNLGYTNLKGHHNTELRTQIHIIGRHIKLHKY